MTATLEAVKELLARIPELPNLIAEANKPTEKTWADTAYIYNGFDDIVLTHLGFDYKLPVGQITMIKGKPDYKEIDQMASNGQEIVWKNIPLKGESIAHELIYEHGFHEFGFTVLTTPEISQEAKDHCDQMAKAYKIKRIEEFKIHRDKARAGIVGYKINPDPPVYRWMQQYSPDDPMFTQSKATTAGQDIAQAISLLTRLVAGQPVADGVAPEAVAPPSEPATDTKKKYPKRKPLESDDDYFARVKQMEQEVGK